MRDDELDRHIAAARPAANELDRRWARARVARGLFGSGAAKPAVVDRFELGDRLGAGGMGVVYAAYDPELDREVAIKLVEVGTAEDRDETHAEAQALARVTHPNVVAVHDVGIVDDLVYIVMEFVRGESLRAFAGKPGRTPREIVAAYRQACAGLAAAHRQNLVHRDFKPDNAIVGADGRVRVIDFGLAQPRDATPRRPAAGTPRYMAPEQARGEEATPAVDQYALCVSLREALAGPCGRDLPGWLEATIARGESRRPQDRFASIEELEAALGRDPRLLWRRRAIAAAVAVSITAAFGGGAMVAAGDQRTDSCTGGAEMIEAAWPARGRDATLARIAELSDYGSALAPHLATRVESFARRWAESHRGICRAHAGGSRSETLFDRQVACLDRGRRALEAAAAIAAEVSASEVAGLAVAIESLPSPESCADITDTAFVDPPAPEIAGEVAARQHDLEAIKIALAAGRFERAWRAAADQVRQARALGYPPLLAEARLLEGRALLLLARREDAIEPLAEATRIALEVGADAIAVEAWARRAWARGTSSDAEGALAGLDVVMALAQRVGRSTFATGLLYNNVGSVRISRGDHRGAQEALAVAVDISRRVSGPGALELVNARGNLAIVSDDAAARDRLAAEAAGAFAELVGPEHPHTLLSTLNRAMVAGDAGAARRLLEPVCSALETLHPHLRRNTHECFYELAWSAASEGDLVAAAEAMTRAADFDADPAAAAIAAGFAGTEEPVAGLEAVLAQRPLAGGEPWWRIIRHAELELALGHADPDRERGAARIAAAARRLEAIDDPLPVVQRRLALARRWLEP